MNPERLLRLAADFFRVLEEIVRRDIRSLTAAEFRELLRLKYPDEARPAFQVIALLEEIGLLEKSPDSEANWELPAKVSEFVRHLSQRQRVSSPGALLPMLDDLAFHTDALRQAIATRAPDIFGQEARIYLPSVIEDIRSVSQDNRMAIENEVMAIKTRRDNRTLGQRYAVIHMLYTRHVEPLREIVDYGKAMDTALKNLLDVIRLGLEVFVSDHDAPDLLITLRRRIKRLQREAYEHFNSSLKDILPLYQKLRKDHALAVAVNRVLDKVGREGVASLPMRDYIPIARWRAENLFSVYALEDYLVGAANYTQQVQPPLLTAADISLPRFRMIDPDELNERLQQALPITDMLTWLFEEFGPYPESQILTAYDMIGRSADYRYTFVEQPVERIIGKARYTFYPMRIDHVA